ncbi:MAG: hypothetical protein ACREFR_12710, partial [Limisphaerales bacterium]
SGTYALGAAPPGFNEILTNTGGAIQLVASAPGPSLAPVSLICWNGGGWLNVSWPPDHTGWNLQAQTNSTDAGLGSHWITLPGSAATNRFAIPIDRNNGCVFLRLEYP